MELTTLDKLAADGWDIGIPAGFTFAAMQYPIWWQGEGWYSLDGNGVFRWGLWPISSPSRIRINTGTHGKVGDGPSLRYNEQILHKGGNQTGRYVLICTGLHHWRQWISPHTRQRYVGVCPKSCSNNRPDPMNWTRNSFPW